jgi:hypothetical protein
MCVSAESFSIYTIFYQEFSTVSDIKKFTGFISSDGKTHTSLKAATAHELELKTVAAVKAAFPDQCIRSSDEGKDRMFLHQFILDNRVDILAALNQEVLLRKKRVVKQKANGTSTELTSALTALNPPN